MNQPRSLLQDNYADIRLSTKLHGLHDNVHILIYNILTARGSEGREVGRDSREGSRAGGREGVIEGSRKRGREGRKEREKQMVEHIAETGWATG